MSALARESFELANKIESVDSVYKYDSVAYNKTLSSRPWTKDVNYFKKVRVSAIALLKMVMHARSGGSIEVMGLMMGKVEGDTMIVMDSFALPVEGTETRVNAQAEGYEYMVDYMNVIKQVGRMENAIGWYHSHPGYGCWLSGIDVSTQMLNQQFQEPWLAIVIDPVRTISSGKVELGAFRTYPEGYKAPDEAPSEYQSIPMSKIEDFGVHCKQYYPLDVSYFKSTLDSALLDLLWNKYWLNTLSSNPLLANREYNAGQMGDLAEKLEQAEQGLGHGSHSRFGGGFLLPSGPGSSASTAGGSGKRGGSSTEPETPLGKLSKDASKLACEQLAGSLSQLIKHSLFNAPAHP
eukprot:TRINITY_DN7585_c0_g1_i1.p1 TRINITY_DN7585_c0_g1~~TRINITY_DN7585_c0_g1_i1.p1  ORF type:complete len:350 (-),score=121.35 TRINITY_DN7585_c0_g1_i1:113-1162(-)